MAKNIGKGAQHCQLLEKCKSKLQLCIILHKSERPSSKKVQTIKSEKVAKKREPSYTAENSMKIP